MDAGRCRNVEQPAKYINIYLFIYLFWAADISLRLNHEYDKWQNNDFSFVI